MPDSGSTGRVKAALIAGAVLCAWGALEAFSWEAAMQRQSHDPYMLSAQDVRLDQIRNAVPADAVMGYVSDLKPGSTEDSAAFGTAQYVLAPRLLKRGSYAHWVLGIISRPDDEITLARIHNLSAEIGFTNGAVLFRNDAVK
jgi:hypothetical protein